MSDTPTPAEQALDILARTLRESAERIAALEAELSQSRAEAAAAAALRDTLQTREQALEERTARCQTLEQELEDSLTQLRRADEKLAARDLECGRLEERHLLDTERLDSLRAEMAGLQLRARWARRRRRLAGKLVAELRQRQRANLALKSGIDTLRQSRHKAEEEHRALQERYRRLQESMRRDDDPAPPPVPHETHRVVEGEDERLSPSGLHRRLMAQSELIESMERDIQRVAALKRDLADREHRIETLEQELAAKQSLITSLEDDLNNTMRSRRIDPRLLAGGAEDPDATFAAEHDRPGEARQQSLAAGLAALEESRPRKQDTGTVKLRVLSETGLQDADALQTDPPQRKREQR